MRAWKTLSAAVFALVVASSCVSAPPRYVNPQHKLPTVISVWVDQRAGLSVSGALAGCNLWNEEDVRCVVARNPLEADVVVVLDPHPCNPDKRDKYVLAHADVANVIGVRLDCFYDSGGNFDAEEYRLVLAHEFGHELGIWDHVPKKCDDKNAPAKKTPDGRLVCGQAIMNPIYDVDVKALTPADGLAFDIHDQYYTVLHRSAANIGRTCTYEKSVR